MNLIPCPYRQVDDEGYILCDKVKIGDREVSPAICRACPIAQINCMHLRATLNHQARTPLTVRYGNGKTEIWDDLAPPIELERAACAVKIIPILSPRDCAGCLLRRELVAVDAITTMEHRRLFTATQSKKRTKGRNRMPRPSPAPLTQPVAAEARTHIVASKIIPMQEWLAKQKSYQPERRDDAAMQLIAFDAGREVVRSRDEEKQVGWTD